MFLRLVYHPEFVRGRTSCINHADQLNSFALHLQIEINTLLNVKEPGF